MTGLVKIIAAGARLKAKPPQNYVINEITDSKDTIGENFCIKDFVSAQLIQNKLQRRVIENV